MNDLQIWGSRFVLRRLMNVWAHDKVWINTLASFGILFFCRFFLFNLCHWVFHHQKKRLEEKNSQSLQYPKKTNMIFLNVSPLKRKTHLSILHFGRVSHVSCWGAWIGSNETIPKKTMGNQPGCCHADKEGFLNASKASKNKMCAKSVFGNSLWNSSYTDANWGAVLH